MNFLHKLKFPFSIAIGILFLVWLFRKVDFAEMLLAIRSAKYGYLLPLFLILMVSHGLRAYRWQLLLKPVKYIRMGPLFSALMIGYMANTFLPAHLGEFVGAFVLSQKKQIPTPVAFSSIVVERIVDMLAFLILMAIAMVLFPFPVWITRGGYLIFFGTVILICFLFFLKIKPQFMQNLVSFFLKPLPEAIQLKILHLMTSFLDGMNGLKTGMDYILFFITSILIWVGYGANFYIAFFMFDLQKYQVGILTALVLLIITTVGVIVPNSPGYVGTYHKLCQLGLSLWQIPESLGATFAVVLHAVNFLPVLILGLIFTAKAGLSISSLSSKEAMEK